MEFFKGVWQNKALKSFLMFFFLFVLVGGALVIVLKHGDMVLFINKYSRESWDGIMNWITYFGLGGVLVVFFILMSFYRIRWALLGLINLAFVGIFTGILKHLFKATHPRPFMYFNYDDFHRFIYTADLNYYSSFPSGHTMAAFASMSILAYLIGKKWVGVLLFFIALLIGFSRMYLCQHFLLDVYFGSIFGICCTMISIFLLDYVFNLNHLTFFHRPLSCLFFKKR